MALLKFTDKGIYCEQADVYIDPWKPVKKAFITHAHADHSRWGHKLYLAHKDSEGVMRLRLGQDLNLQTVEYNQDILINQVKFTFYPAGHIVGSSQIRVEYKGEVWVASGDYKPEPDGVSTPFEPVKCHTFITECTFGLPAFHWKPQSEIMNEINQWWRQNSAEGKCSLLFGYSLGKAQRILCNIDPSIGPILVHGAIANTNEALQHTGIKLPPTTYIDKDIKKELFKNALVIAPPSAIGSAWAQKLKPYATGIASGWMNLRGTRRRKSVDRGFVLSDHADWNGLNESIKATGAENIITTHGYTNIFTKWLQEQGYNAMTENTDFEGELAEINEAKIQEPAS